MEDFRAKVMVEVMVRGDFRKRIGRFRTDWARFTAQTNCVLNMWFPSSFMSPSMEMDDQKFIHRKIGIL